MHKNHSFKKAIARYSLLIVCIFLIVSLSMTAYLSAALRESTYKNVHQTMDLYNQQLSESLTRTKSTLVLYTLNNADFGMMAYDTAPGNSALDQVRVHSLIQIMLPGLSNTDGIFVYTKNTDCYVSESKLNIDPCSAYVRDSLRSGVAEDLALTDKWLLRLLDGDYYLISIIDLSNSYAGAWVSLDTLTQAFSDLNADTIFIYTDQKGRPLGTSESAGGDESIVFSPEDTLNASDVIVYQGKKYLQVSEALDFCDYYLIALIPVSSIYNPIRPIAGVLIVILLLFVFFLLVNFHITNRIFDKPLLAIQKASSRITRKDYSTLLEIRPDDYEEIQELTHSINELITQVTTLQKDVYEESLLKSEFELQYLKSQVSPHFLINCFSTIGAIPDTEEGKSIRREMIRTLSDHLRYTLGRQKHVVLEDELYYVENYIALSNIRFPDCLKTEINVDEECMGASVFPLLLLSLTENTIKYNLVMGEELVIRVEGHLAYKPDGSCFLHLVHLDSGSGYPEESLEEMNNLVHLNVNPNIQGFKIGVFNTVKRIQLIYGETASIHFSNEPGMGARCDITIPYIADDFEEDE